MIITLILIPLSLLIGLFFFWMMWRLLIAQSNSDERSIIEPEYYARRDASLQKIECILLQIGSPKNNGRYDDEQTALWDTVNALIEQNDKLTRQENEHLASLM